MDITKLDGNLGVVDILIKKKVVLFLSDTDCQSVRMNEKNILTCYYSTTRTNSGNQT